MQKFLAPRRICSNMTGIRSNRSSTRAPCALGPDRRALRDLLAKGMLPYEQKTHMTYSSRPATENRTAALEQLTRQMGVARSSRGRSSAHVASDHGSTAAVGLNPIRRRRIGSGRSRMMVVNRALSGSHFDMRCGTPMDNGELVIAFWLRGSSWGPSSSPVWPSGQC
jgi:hypothetical protein